MDEMMLKYDTNRSGKLEEAQLALMLKDLNGDVDVSKEELTWVGRCKLNPVTHSFAVVITTCVMAEGFIQESHLSPHSTHKLSPRHEWRRESSPPPTLSRRLCLCIPVDCWWTLVAALVSALAPIK